MTDKITLTPSMSSLVKIRREARGLTQAELGRQVGASRAQIKRIEALEVSAVNSKTLKRLAKKLNAPLLRCGTITPLTDKQRENLNKRLKAREDRQQYARGVQDSQNKRASALKLLKKHGLLDVTLGDLLG